MTLQEAIDSLKDKSIPFTLPYFVNRDCWHGKNCEARFMPAIPGSSISLSFDKSQAKRCLWSDKWCEQYIEYHEWYLLELNDGRYVVLEDWTGGTCNSCGSCGQNLSFAATLEEAIKFGMYNWCRRQLGIEL